MTLPAENEPAVPRITGGSTTRPGAHPWQASIRVRGRDKTYHWCGAAIVSHYHVVTAAHCLREFPQSTYLVRVGDWALDVDDKFEEEFDIDSIYFHENYNIGPYLNNDIAVIKIRYDKLHLCTESVHHSNRHSNRPNQNGSGFTYGDRVAPVCLPPESFIYSSSMNLTITGWGKLGYDGAEGDQKSPAGHGFGNVKNLMAAMVPIIPRQLCSQDDVSS